MKFLSQFGLLLVIVGTALVVTVIASVPSGWFMSNNHISLAYHWMQWMQTLILMIMAPLCWYRWIHLPKQRSGCGSVGWKDCLKAAGLLSLDKKYMYVTFCFMLVSLPMLNSFEVFMNRLPWPEPVKSYILEGFEANQRIISLVLAPTGVLATFEQFLLICLFTAIGEELMFRGALFSCFRKYTELNIHWVAFLVGFIFALIHFEPAGFLIRMLLGMLLVYLVEWSGSLWPSILAHCMNNSWALIGYSLTTPEERSSLVQDYTFGFVLTAFSTLLAMALLYVLWQMRHSK